VLLTDSLGSVQAVLDADTLEDYGGTYMIDCRNPVSPKVTILADTIVFLHGNKRITGSNVDSIFSYFEPSQPVGFRLAMLPQATTPSGLDMAWLVFQDESGMYLTMDKERDPKSLEAIGEPLAGLKFRRCDGKPAKPAAVPAATPQRTYTLLELDASGILLDPKAKAAYYKALGRLVEEDWLANLDGPTTENRKVTIAGNDYLFAISCKNHDCYDNNTVLLYSEAQGIVYGKIFLRGRSELIGAPPHAVEMELERLWRDEWRQNPQ
jgi:hypothetical protein